MTDSTHIPACTEKTQIIDQHQLPLSCPMDSMMLWNAHPKVYLPIAQNGTATCPYCGTQYALR